MMKGKKKEKTGSGVDYKRDVEKILGDIYVDTGVNGKEPEGEPVKVVPARVQREEKREKTEETEETEKSFGEEAPDKDLDPIIQKAAIAAIILAIIVTVVLVLETRQESYSALYIKPDSYSNYLEGDTVAFTYGVQCFETQRTDYQLDVFLGISQVASRNFFIEGRGKTFEETIAFEVPRETEFPVKVSLVLTGNGETYTTHFWLKGRE